MLYRKFVKKNKKWTLNGCFNVHLQWICSLYRVYFMRFIFSFLVCLFSLVVSAQSVSRADELFNKRDYLQAGQVYEALLRKRPADALYNYRFARCSYELKEYETAISHFLKSGTKYPLRDYYLADSYFQLYRFSEAIRYFNAYAESTEVNQAFMSDVDDKLRRAVTGERLLNRVEDVEITDSLVVYKKDFLSRYELSKETGTLEQKSVNSGQHGWIDLITFTTQRGDRKLYSDTVNHSLDLYTANKLLDGWSRSERLSAQVNTDANENYPFLMLDGLTLYFASDGEGSLGGYDLFVTRFSGVSNDYLNPDNAGMPFNSLYNDYMLVIDELNHAGWFVSDRYQPRNKVAIYRFEFSGEKKFLKNDSTPDFLARATLRKIRWAEQTSVQKRRIAEPEQKGNQPVIAFVITDNLVYNSADQFKSPAATQLFTRWSGLKQELKQLEDKQLELRRSYSNAEEEVERAGLGREMTATEREVLRVRRELETLEKNIRNEEIKFLKKSDIL